MKTPRAVLSLVLVSFSALAFAHSPAQMSSAQSSPAQKSFTEMKSLAGIWEGTLTTFPAAASYQGKPVKIQLRVTSSGNAILHEMSVPGEPDDPITMLYVNNNRLYLRHYCDAGNRPRMVAQASPDGKTITFNLRDVSGSKHYGYMEHVVFTAIDAGHHSEDWTFLEPGNHPVRAHFELHRVQ